MSADCESQWARITSESFSNNGEDFADPVLSRRGSGARGALLRPGGADAGNRPGARASAWRPQAAPS